MSLSIATIRTILTEHHLLKQITNEQAITFDAITYDSRKVNGQQPLFFCKGNFRPQYLTAAANAGAVGYVAEQLHTGVDDLVGIQVTDVQKAMALLSAAFYDFPQNELFIIAYTGTKGKTTAAYLTRGLLQAATEGRTALFSTVDRILGPTPADRFKSDLTTPESIDLFHDMRRAVDNGMTHLVMEVSSQAFKRNRVYGLRYNVGIFLNITPDHIGRNEHPTFADYLHCKEQLMIQSDQCIINADTQHFADVYYAAKTTSEPTDIFLFGHPKTVTEPTVPIDFRIQNDGESLTASEFNVEAATDRAETLAVASRYELAIAGDYNEENATAAIIAAGLAGAHPESETAKKNLANVRIPGRMEQIVTQHHGRIFVDYAHNYASLHALLHFLRAQTGTGKVVVVVGSPGDKGISRRAGFGKALTEEADKVYLTTDDPGFEDPVAIAKAIDEHIDHQKVTVQFEMDRPTAIKLAIHESLPGDVVVLAGKGEDPYQKIKGVDVPYPSDWNIAVAEAKGL